MINSQIFLIFHTITTRNSKMLMFLPDIMEAKMAASEQDDDVLPWRQSVDLMKFLDGFFPSTEYHVMLNLRSGPILAASIKNRVLFQVTLCSKMTQCCGIVLSVAQILIFCRFQHDCHTSPSPLLQSEKENRIWTKDKI